MDKKIMEDGRKNKGGKEKKKEEKGNNFRK
jgi:hypothetical protein